LGKTVISVRISRSSHSVSALFAIARELVAPFE
jgi:hypothetical protein